jgi:hypothetical protein
MHCPCVGHILIHCSRSIEQLTCALGRPCATPAVPRDVLPVVTELRRKYGGESALDGPAGCQHHGALSLKPQKGAGTRARVPAPELRENTRGHNLHLAAASAYASVSVSAPQIWLHLYHRPQITSRLPHAARCLILRVLRALWAIPAGTNWASLLAKPGERPSSTMHSAWLRSRAERGS